MTVSLIAASATQPTPAFIGLIIFIIFVALIFDFLNGFHDAANSIATIVSTRVLSPTQAVAWAAFFNFIAAFLFGTTVAGTIGSGLIHSAPQFLDVYVVLAGLTGAIVWNIITWWLALPTSSSHALVSAAAGAAIAKGGFGAIVIGSKWGLLLLFIVLSPLIGMLLGGFLMIVLAWTFRRAHPHKVDTAFRRLQLVSAAIYSLGHGGNDAQKTMGIIILLLSAAGLSNWGAPDPHNFVENGFAWLRSLAGETGWAHSLLNLVHHQHSVAWWVILSCHAAIALGTMFGGWRIVKTMGSGITKLQPIGGFCAETAAATTIILATRMGIPISTTHAITGSILGVGTTKGVRSVRWIWGQRIILAWVLTIPCSAFIAAVTYFVIHLTLEAWFR
ncbi:inorganic phosphate transporter [Humisphaera borealis]|uniref:Phosphate transporter n=1 Tax=Humisphaera borealis TaxID=2807512 RepID=A0A7M2X211_9BACT|nr:inorganic phosphate transporter [Humisphaera borealis]QOV90780.1 inorganic phosphate transporter [Humisphaera borealis]